MYMTMTKYDTVKKWRQKNKRNAAYSRKWMKFRRAMFRRMYLAGEIAYKDIPPSYRHFTDSRGTMK